MYIINYVNENGILCGKTAYNTQQLNEVLRTITYYYYKITSIVYKEVK